MSDNWRYEFQRRVSADTALSNISLVCLDPGDMDTCLTRDAPFFIEVLMKWIIPMLVPVLVLLQPKGFLRISTKPGRSCGPALMFDENWRSIPRRYTGISRRWNT